jgi:ataxin-3
MYDFLLSETSSNNFRKICNRQRHWFAIRKINGRYYNLNSTLERPEIISHFKLVAEMEAFQVEGYSVFCVLDSLPPPCTSLGLPQYWWKEEDLISGKSHAITRADNPWTKVGSGRRLDGKAGNDTNGMNVSEMTEEEMLHAAIAASMDQLTSSNNDQDYNLTEEPVEGAPGAVKIQFRLPDGTRDVRRFDSSNPVAAVYAFVANKCSNQRIGLHAGFPPKDIGTQKGLTITESKLAGEMIHVRYI